MACLVRLDRLVRLDGLDRWVRFDVDISSRLKDQDSKSVSEVSLIWGSLMVLL